LLNSARATLKLFCPGYPVFRLVAFVSDSLNDQVDFGRLKTRQKHIETDVGQPFEFDSQDLVIPSGLLQRKITCSSEIRRPPPSRHPRYRRHAEQKARIFRQWLANALLDRVQKIVTANRLTGLHIGHCGREIIGRQYLQIHGQLGHLSSRQKLRKNNMLLVL
jgi:hypothetical protein